MRSGGGKGGGLISKGGSAIGSQFNSKDSPEKERQDIPEKERSVRSCPPPTKNVNYILDYRLGRQIELFPTHVCEYAHPLAKIYLYTYDLEYYWLTYVYAFGIYNVQ